MNPCNSLHGSTIASPQPVAVDALHGSYVGGTIVRDGNIAFASQLAGHACAPNYFIRQRLRCVGVQMEQLFERILGCVVNTGYEFE